MSDLVFEHTLHRTMWLYLAEHPGVVKVDAVVYLKIEGLLTIDMEERLWNHARCFACLYADKVYKPLSVGGGRCGHCPFKNVNRNKGCLNAVFNDWHKTTCDLNRKYFTPASRTATEKLCSMYARCIANWPVKDDVICR